MSRDVGQDHSGGRHTGLLGEVGMKVVDAEGSAAVPVAVQRALARSLAAVADSSSMRAVCAGLLLEGFATPDEGSYTRLATMAREADALGYPLLH